MINTYKISVSERENFRDVVVDRTIMSAYN
jgi:hypothetical protein